MNPITNAMLNFGTLLNTYGYGQASDALPTIPPLVAGTGPE